MQRELVLDIDKPLAEALAAAVDAMIDEARVQTRRAVEEPGQAVHDYRRALRRAEAVVGLAFPMLRRVPRRWLVRSFDRARRRTRIVRDLDAVMPMLDKLREAELLDPGDGSIDAVKAWLEACKGELASQEIVAWRLRKNVRALAGLGEMFRAAAHAWLDLELLVESLRESYRGARRVFRQAQATRKTKDVHELRRVVRKLRYQLELLASLRRPATTSEQPAAAPEAPAAPAPPPEPAWLSSILSAHTTMKELVKELGAVTDLMALRAIVEEADAEGAGFSPGHLSAVLGEMIEGRIERVLIDAANAFQEPGKRFLAPEAAPASQPSLEDHAATD